MHSQDFSRAERLSDLIRAEVSEIIRDHVKDPRLKGITIISVELSKDIKNAFIFYSLLNSFNSLDPNEIAEGFSKAKPFIRRRLGSRLSIKRIPDLKFLPEDGIKN
jgi:ribosome-binding factor A